MQSAASLSDPDELPLAYARDATLALAYANEHRRILVIGLGGGTIPVYLARFMPDAIIDTVELDPGVIAAAKRYFGIGETDRVRYFAGDGRVWLNRHPDKYDIIIVDVFRKDFVPFHFVTREFYTLLKRRLQSGGAAVVNVVGGTKLYAGTLSTLKAAFATVDLYGSEERNVVAIARSEPRPAPELLRDKAAALQQRYRFRYPLPDLINGRMAWPSAKGMEFTDDFAPVEAYQAARRINRNAR